MTYIQEIPRAQAPVEDYIDSVNILEDASLDAEYLGPRQTQSETVGFLSRLHAYDPDLLKWSVITCWEGSAWQPKVFDAHEAIYWLQIFGILSAEQLVSSPENFLRLWVQREREKAAGIAPVAQGGAR